MGAEGVWTGAAINNGQWRLVVTTYDATTGIATSYLDGTERNTLAMSPTAEGNLANLAIGGPGGDGWTGFIDEVKVYSYPLTSDEITQYYIAVTGKPLCINPGFVGSAYDFNGDCAVDMLDFAKFAEAWLANGFYQAP